jgi:hypothetical protein
MTELEKTKAELNSIKSINPDNNLRYLINQIEVGNIKTSNNEKVLNILNEVKKGIQNINHKLYKKKEK